MQARAMATLDRLAEQHQEQTLLTVGYVGANRALFLGFMREDLDKTTVLPCRNS